MKGSRRQWLRDIVGGGGNAIYIAVLSVLNPITYSELLYYYTKHDRAAIRDAFGEKVFASLPKSKHLKGNRQQKEILSRQLLELYTSRFPGIIHSCRGDHTDPKDRYFNDRHVTVVALLFLNAHAM